MTRPAGALIKKHLKMAGMMQKALARQMNISESSLSNIITGRQRVSAKIAVNIEKHLGFTCLFAESLCVAEMLEDLKRAYEEAEDDPPPVVV